MTSPGVEYLSQLPLEKGKKGYYGQTVTALSHMQQPYTKPDSIGIQQGRAVYNMKIYYCYHDVVILLSINLNTAPTCGDSQSFAISSVQMSRATIVPVVSCLSGFMAALCHSCYPVIGSFPFYSTAFRYPPMSISGGL